MSRPAIPLRPIRPSGPCRLHAGSARATPLRPLPPCAIPSPNGSRSTGHPRPTSRLLTASLLATVALVLLTHLPASLAAPRLRQADTPFLNARLIFPPEHWHNHGSTLIETRRGDLLVCWFHGSGERRADDVVIRGARLRRGAGTWSEPFLLADTPGYPDTNCTLFLDGQGRLWLIWPTILANLWESALLKYRISDDFERPGPPRWKQDGVLHVTPGPEFQEAVQAWLPSVERRLESDPMPDSMRREVERYLDVFRHQVEDKLYLRLGWMTRAHPYLHEGHRIILPLYHDGFSCSLMAVSDDHGATWTTTAPLLGGGNIQPHILQRRDGSLVAYMRDNGPPPKRVPQSESRDGGLTWSPVTNSDIPNPGAGTDGVVLHDGRWLFIGNDTESGRHRLVVMLSDDDGLTWSHRRALEDDPPGPLAGRYHYPSILQSRDGTLHVTYSHHLSTARTDLPLDGHGKPAHSSIKHAHFNIAWVLAGERLP
ncbi:MAG: exo-alpha-sialidase [Verrucomicrobiae bacterium]|nr:exo-alpha-sialidase [Verrucomicrobiae bacterium]